MVAWEKEIGILPGIKSLTFAGMEAGPPGDPIEVWLQGHDMDEILAAADDLMAAEKIRRRVSDPKRLLSREKRDAAALKPEARTLG
jgi:hypothetical protein